MGRQVKCKCHGEKHDVNELYKVEHITKGGIKQNYYYCSEDIYNKIVRDKEDNKACFELINNIFGRKVLNTVLKKEMYALSELYGWRKIKSYLEDNSCYIIDNMNKNFSSEYAEIRYFSAILKNSLNDYKHEESKQKIIKTDENIIDEPQEVIVKSNYRKKEKKKRNLSEIEV